MADRRQYIPSAIVLSVCVVVLAVWIWIEKTPVERMSPPPGQAIVIDKSPQAQGERKAVLDRLVDQGLVRRYDPKGAGSIQVSLRPAFYELDEKTRTKYLHEVYGYYFDGSSTTDSVVLRDARHGNNVGRYSPYGEGLIMYK